MKNSEIIANNFNEAFSEINALKNYANRVTGGNDTKLGDAIKTLADGYGKGEAKEGYAEGTINILQSTRSVEMNHNLNTNEDLAFMFWCDFEDLKTIGAANRLVAVGGIIRGSEGIFKNGIELPYATVPFDKFGSVSCWSIVTNSSGLVFSLFSITKTTSKQLESNNTYYCDENTFIVRGGSIIGNANKIHWRVRALG